MHAKSSEPITALVADSRGQIMELEGYGAVGMAGDRLMPLSIKNTIRMPHGGELLYLPDRYPVVHHQKSNQIVTLMENPCSPSEPVFPVAAFNSPGYVAEWLCGYAESSQASILPLFAYAAVGWYRGHYRSPVFLVDAEKRQDLRLMPMTRVLDGVEIKRQELPHNRLRAHLENCALTFGCPAGKNFFLKRFEAPLPTSPRCNARCLGCLSSQPGTDVPTSQNRIDFTPSAREIAEVALSHIEQVQQSVVSFGQGCEGDPLAAAEVIMPAIRMIRAKTSAGTIHMNTNGSRPDLIEGLFDAGLDSLRISMNSFRKKCYHAYFRPQGYDFSDVITSVDAAIQRHKFIAVNYLNSPGFTDSPEETTALEQFLDNHQIQMIQWRNLNFDPLRYWQRMRSVSPMSAPMGMRQLIDRIHKRFPDLRHGYFNPPRETFKNMSRG